MPRRPLTGDFSDQPWVMAIKSLLQRYWAKHLVLGDANGRILIDAPLPPALAVLAVLFLVTPRLIALAALAILFLGFSLRIEPE